MAGNTTRVNASDLTGAQLFLSTNFNYDTGPFDNIQKITPAKPWMLKGDYNVNNANKVTFKYNQLDSNSPVGQSGSSSLGITRGTGSTNFLSYANSNYAILENLKSGVGEWNSVFGNMTNNLLLGYTHQDESRGPQGQTPAVPVRRHRRRCRRLADRVRQRAVHAVQPAPLQHVPGAGQRDEVRQEPLDHLRRQPREVPLRQLVLLRHPERLLVPLAGRLLHRREQLPRQPEPHGVAGDAGPLPGEVPAAAGPDDAAAPAARRDLRRRLHPGRVASEGEPHRHRRPPHRRAEVRQHGVRQPGGRQPDLPRSGRLAGEVQHRRAAGGHAVLVAARRHQLGRQRQPGDADPRRIGSVLG